MAIPTVVNVGAVSSAAGATISPTMPASVLTGDILLLCIESAIAEGTVTGGSETWVAVADSPQTIGSGATLSRISCYWARASQYSPTSPTVGAPSNHQQGFIIAFRGCHGTGNPWDVTSGGTEAGPDTSLSITGDITTVADCLIVLLCGQSLPDATSTTEFGAMTNADLASLTERVDNTMTSGNGGGLFCGTGTKASIGSYTATTLTTVTSASHSFMSIALKPPQATTFTQAIAAVAVPVATLTRLNTFSRTLAAVAVPVATLTKQMYVVMSATATGVATLVTALLFSVSAAAVAVGVATLTTVATFSKALAAIAVGVASLTATFIAGAAAVVARVQGFIVNVGSMMMRR